MAVAYVIAVASLGDYRGNVVAEVRKQIGDAISIYAGSPSYEPSIRLLDYQHAGVISLRNFYLPGNVLLQSVPFVDLLRANSVILDLNPRVPHVWIVAAIRRLMGKRTMLWGHAWPHSGKDSRSDRIRGLLRRLSTGLVAYTESQASELRRILPGRPIEAAPNALYRREQMHFEDNKSRFRVLYVGRLVDEKKPRLLLDAFMEIADVIPEVVLTIVGDGPARASLQAQAVSSPYSDRIELPGYVSGFDDLRPIYAESIVSVSPGYVGLSITQSLAFGVPMLISRTEHHSPELEAVREGFNAEFFETDDVSALANALLEFVRAKERWSDCGSAISRDCAERYSVERMAQGLIDALTGEG